jgi:hypothetical protein
VIEIILAAAISTSVPERWPLWPQFWSRYEAEMKKDGGKKNSSGGKKDAGKR